MNNGIKIWSLILLENNFIVCTTQAYELIFSVAVSHLCVLENDKLIFYSSHTQFYIAGVCNLFCKQRHNTSGALVKTKKYLKWYIKILKHYYFFYLLNSVVTFLPKLTILLIPTIISLPYQ